MLPNIKHNITRRKYLFASLMIFLISIACLAFSFTGNDDFSLARREVLLRKIGHELLLQSGDSTSRVLPVIKIAENEYQVRFENELTFRSDSLMNITRRLLAKDPLATDYVVNVVNTRNASIVYGFAISQNTKNNVITCNGRKQPAARYALNIRFKPGSIDSIKGKVLLGGLPLLAFIGFILLSSVKPHDSSPSGHDKDGILAFGSSLFHAGSRKLIINGNTTDLTGTESRLLLIFASSPNEVIERNRLQKEIWEDAGVIVGRSLDMFISKIRKKLEPDPNISIVVVRGKGYKMKINA